MTALAHWIWQGLVLVAVVSLCLSRARQVSASTRYYVWWATLALVVALPFLGVLDLPGFGAVIGVSGPVEISSGPAPERPALMSMWISWLPVVAFGSWVLWSLTRVYAAFAHLDAVKRSCRPFPIVRERALPQWKAARNRGRRATLVVSSHIRAAAVLGLGYPRIAVAPELVSSLTDDELDQLVLHEYAHVQRRDDHANAVQLLVNGLVGWHPAVWWIDRCLRVEREVACDDWVLATTGAPRTYARCLTRIADVAVGSESSLLPAASCRRQLTTRVVRLLDGRRSTSIRPSAAALAMATMILAVVSVGLAGSHTTAIALPAVARAGFAPTVHTPELTFARLFQAVSEPGGRRAARLAREASVDALLDVPTSAHFAVVHVALPAAINPTVADAMTAAADRPPHSGPMVATDEPASPRDGAASSIVVDGMAVDTLPSAEADESDSWIDTTRRALAEAGKTTGQSLAEAGKSTGVAVAEASVVAARSTQKSAVKAGRFFSRLGRTLAKPF